MRVLRKYEEKMWKTVDIDKPILYTMERRASAPEKESDLYAIP